MRCAPIFTSLHNSNTGSSIEVVDAVVNFSFTKELDQSIYRVHRKIIEAIEWSDAVFLGAEFFFLTRFISNKPIIGVPIGFEFSRWNEKESNQDSRDFYRAAAACDAYIFPKHAMSVEKSGSIADFFIRLGLENKLLDLPFMPIDFDLSELITKSLAHTPKHQIEGRYIFYVGRINTVSDMVADNKGWRLLFAALPLVVSQFKKHFIRLTVVVRDQMTADALRALPSEVRKILVPLNSDHPSDLGYHDFLHVCKNSLGVIENCGVASAAGLAAADALSLGKPIMTVIGRGNYEEQQLQNIIYDVANVQRPEEIASMLEKLLLNVSSDPPPDQDFREMIERSSGFFSARQFAHVLEKELQALITKNSVFTT